MNDIIGKTVQNVEVEEWAGRDTFKDTVTWDRTVITFTDGTTTQFDSWDGEVYDPYRCVFDDEGQPHRLVEESTTCRHCGHGIGYDAEEGWVAPDAGFDVEGGDGIWRATCPDNHTERAAPHEPVEWAEYDTAPCVDRGEHIPTQRHPQADCPTEPYRCTACGRPEDDCSKDPCAAVIKDRES